MKRATALLALVLTLVAALARTARADDVFERKTRHFCLLYLESEVRKKWVHAEILESYGKWLDAAYDRLVTQIGFPPPKVPLYAGKIPVVVRSMPGLPGCFRADASGESTLYLNPRFHGVVGTKRHNLLMPIMQATCAHEFFHAVHHAVAPSSSRFLPEATAQWAEDEVFPDLDDVIDHELTFLEHPRTSLHFVSGTGDLNVGTGRPYGSSLFFRFLSKHHPSGARVVRAIWEQLAAGEGPSELNAIGRALGGRDALDAPFREVFDRFALGCLLHAEAPADCRLPDLDELRTAESGPATAKQDDAGERILRHLRTTFRDAKTAEVGVPTMVGGFGTAYQRIEVPPGTPLPARATLQACVVAGEGEVRLRAVSWDGSAWKVHASGYDAATRGHVVRVPDLDRATKPVTVILTRYDGSTEAKRYSVRYAVGEPPVLKSFLLRQRGKDAFRAVTEEVLGADGLLAGRTTRSETPNAPQAGVEADVWLEFSAPVSPSPDGPLLTVDGKEVHMSPEASDADRGGAGADATDGARVWAGRVPSDAIEALSGRALEFRVRAQSRPPGTHAVLPLDEDPTTVARFLPEASGYEEGADGVRVTVTPRPTGPGLMWYRLDRFPIPHSNGFAEDYGELPFLKPVLKARHEADGSFAGTIDYAIQRGPVSVAITGTAKGTIDAVTGTLRMSFEARVTRDYSGGQGYGNEYTVSGSIHGVRDGGSNGPGAWWAPRQTGWSNGPDILAGSGTVTLTIRLLGDRIAPEEEARLTPEQIAEQRRPHVQTEEIAVWDLEAVAGPVAPEDADRAEIAPLRRTFTLPDGAKFVLDQLGDAVLGTIRFPNGNLGVISGLQIGDSFDFDWYDSRIEGRARLRRQEDGSWQGGIWLERATSGPPVDTLVLK